MTHQSELIDQLYERSSTPLSGCIHQLFDAQAARTPHTTALVFEDQHLTYCELNRRANQLAQHLQTLGVGPDIRVGICLERSLDMVMGILGILKAGGTYVPFDPQLPTERLAFMFANAQVAVLLTHEWRRAAFPTHDALLICLDSAWSTIAQERDEPPISATTPEHLVYVLYTSGSTGRPKGVAVEHRHLLHYLNGISERLDFPIGANLAMISTFAADLGNTVVFPSLCCGGCLHIVSQERTTDPDALAEYCYCRWIDCLKIVPSHLMALLTAAQPERVLPRRWLVLGGEAASQQLIAQIQRLAPDCTILNHYGPTETTVGVLTYPVEPGMFDRYITTVPLGYPLRDTRVYILDRKRHPVRAGEPGELYIGGGSLARGYLDHPDLTAERFIPNPFGAAIGERLYKTGDRACQLPNGALTFLGRVDHQVKIRGFRIELGEIETALTQHPSVQAAIALAREDETGDRQLVAYVVPLAEQSLTTSDLRAFLRMTLPDYMIPAAFVLLTSLPLTPNGKIDRHALPLPDSPRSNHDATFVAPRTPVESLIADLWADILGCANIGIYDNFFDLGGHSLLAAQVLTRVRSMFQVELSLRSLFDTPTVIGLAETLIARAPLPRKVVAIARLRKQIDAMSPDEIRTLVASQNADWPASVSITAPAALAQAVAVPHQLLNLVSLTAPAALAHEKEALLAILLNEEGFNRVDTRTINPRTSMAPPPLSFAQQRLWFMDQLAPDSPFYNLPVAVRLNGALWISALIRSLNTIAQRHESLRTTFAIVDGQPVQVIAPALPLALPLLDLSALPPAQRTALAPQLITQAAQQPFDLTRGPLLRNLLLRLAPQEHMLLLTMHHSISDGWSVEVFFRELGICYTATCAGRPAPLAPLPIQYADYTLWQRRWLRGAVLGSQIAYWSGLLADAPALLELPTDRPRPVAQTFRGAVHGFTLPTSLCSALGALSRQEEATLFMTLLAAWQLLLARYTGRHDIVVGTPIAGRTLTEVEALIGFFANTLVIRTDLAGNPSFRELLGRVREVCLGAYAHQDLPFEKLVEELRPERNLSFNPLIQVMFALQNEPVLACKIPDLGLERVNIDSGRAKFDVSLLMKETAHAIVGELEYNTDLFDATTIARMTNHFQTLLEGIVAEPDCAVCRLPFVTAAERLSLLVAWNDTRTVQPLDHMIAQLIEAQVARRPDALALVVDSRAAAGDLTTGAVQHLTYDELNQRANRLAHYLRACGVRPEVRVGICLERSLDLVIGLLAILKAGGAYVPIDPAYPLERRAFLIADAQAPILLTHAALSAGTSDSAVRRICLEQAWPQIARQPATNLPASATADQLAYVIYTSGSTGRPKGVPIDQRGVLNLIGWHQRAFAVSTQDRATQVAGPAFDATGWELWPYLTSGASIHMPSEEIRITPDQLRDWLVAQAITLSFLPTPLAERMIELTWPTRVPLRALLTGGDRLHQSPPLGLPFALVNNYGPTESSVVSTSGVVAATDNADRAPMIGRPISNIQLYVLDAHGQVAPIGVSGELYIGGAGLARGYLGRPDLTAERFVPNPFVTTDERRTTNDETAARPGVRRPASGVRLYKTGDLVRYRADGMIEFLGRIDQQVQIRGFRIELGEIEALLGQHPALQAAVVLTHEAAPGDLRLVAYAVPEQDVRERAAGNSEYDRRSILADHQTSLVGELRAFLQEKLPDYMVPAVFVLLEALPLSANGKVDRRALPCFDATCLELAESFVAPRNAVEEVLAQIWSDILGNERVGIHDNFFALGGHSLLATKVIAQIREALDLELPLSRLFETPTVADLATMILQSAEDVARIERTAQLLLWLAQASDDEMETLLGQEIVELPESYMR
jgi:amino acid adenylation domain-containing protein